MIPDAPRPSTNPTQTLLITSHAVDCVIGNFHTETQKKQVNHSNPKPTTTSVQNAIPPSSSPGKTSEVDTIHSMSTDKYKNKKKGKGKNKKDKNNNQQPDKPKAQPANEKEKRKPHYPCLICGEDHYMKDCSRRA